MQPSFQKLTRFLIEHEKFWRMEPYFLSQHGGFDSVMVTEKERALHQWLVTLNDQEVEFYQSSPIALLQKLGGWIAELPAIYREVLPDEQDVNGAEQVSAFHFQGIPGRKQLQIKKMIGQIGNNVVHSEWLEWCSGKGYLGRILTLSSGQPVKSLEYQANLCLAGQQYAAQKSLPIQFINIDVMVEQVKEQLHTTQHAVALHACGDLHIRLLHLVAEKKLSGVTLVPCCFHLTDQEWYQPLSECGKKHNLELSKSELRIPLQKTVTGGERVRRHRYLEMSYRLGLQALVSDVKCSEDYISFPSIKKSVLKLGFKHFCLLGFEYKGWPEPKNTDWDKYQRIGEQRFAVMERLSLLQSCFHALIEMWLLYDKALFLTENGYNIQLSRFCSEEITPRNFLIHAVLAANMP